MNVKYTSQEPEATAAADPPEEPPATRCSDAAGLAGLRTGPKCECTFSDLYSQSQRLIRAEIAMQTHPMPNSSMLVLPTIAAPFCLSKETTVAS